MKQPELGNQIGIERKAKGYTQQELAEECKVDIRTIQRIETGEVTPRQFTLRIINEKLGTDFDLNGDLSLNKIQGSKKAFRFGWIFGIVLFCLLPVMVLEASGFFRTNIQTLWFLSTFILYLCIHVLSTVFFYRAIFFTGKYLNNPILKAGAIITIVVVALLSISKIVLGVFMIPANIYVTILLGILIGLSTIIVGVGFVVIKKIQPTLAIVIGVIQIVAGVFYIFAGLVGIILGGASLILQIIFLMGIEKRIEN